MPGRRLFCLSFNEMFRTLEILLVPHPYAYRNGIMEPAQHNFNMWTRNHTYFFEKNDSLFYTNATNPCRRSIRPASSSSSSAVRTIAGDRPDDRIRSSIATAVGPSATMMRARAASSGSSGGGGAGAAGAASANG